jgi:hypothetical protein
LRCLRAKRRTPPESTIAPSLALKYLSASNTRQAICLQVANTSTSDAVHMQSLVRSYRAGQRPLDGAENGSYLAKPRRGSLRAALGPQGKRTELSALQAMTICLPRERLLAHLSHRYYEMDRHTDTEQILIFFGSTFAV